MPFTLQAGDALNWPFQGHQSLTEETVALLHDADERLTVWIAIHVRFMDQRNVHRRANFLFKWNKDEKRYDRQTEPESLTYCS